MKSFFAAISIHLALGLAACVPYPALALTGPSFLPSPESYTVEVGSTAVMECSVKDLKDRMVIWRKADQVNPLTVGQQTFWNDDRYMVQHHPSQPQWNLVIREVNKSDAGLYECQVSSTQRHLRHHVLLTVADKEITTTVPRPDIKISGVSYVEKGGQIYLVCNATGLEQAPDDVDWFHNGNELSTISNNNKITITKVTSISARTISSSLLIKDAQSEDSGDFLCRTSNLQMKSLRVTVLNSDSNNNVRRGTIAGSSVADQPKDSGQTLTQVLHRHLLASIATTIALRVYWLFPS